MTLREFILRRDGYKRLWVEEWQKVRFLGFKMVEPYIPKESSLTLYEFFPLPGDPTEEDIKKTNEERAIEQRKIAEATLQKYKELGFIKSN